jgi:hypothetical protein
MKKEELLKLSLSVLATRCRTTVLANPSSTAEERQMAWNFVDRFTQLNVKGRSDGEAKIESDRQRELLRQQIADFLSWCLSSED